MNILVLGLGNELLSDDGVGILAAHALADALRDRADVIATAEHGLALFDHFLGYQRAIIIDAICTGVHPTGAIIELDPATLDAVITPSPHYTGLPEMLQIADQLALDFPREIKILAMEVADPHTIDTTLTPLVQRALPVLVARVIAQVEAWENAPTPA